MFYAHFVLAKKGPLARIWLAAHWDKKLTKAHVFETNIEKSVDGILQPKVKMALRTSGHLLLGVVRIYSRKAKYLLADCNEAFVKIKMAFRPGIVDLPEDIREAAVSAITFPEVFHDFDTPMPELKDVDIQAQFTLNQSRAEEITMREDYGSISFVTADDGFGDIGFEETPDLMRATSGIDQSLDQTNLMFGDSIGKERDLNSSKEQNSRLGSSRANASALDLEAPIRDDGFGGNLGQDIIAGGLFEGGLFDDGPMEGGPPLDSGQIEKEDKGGDESDDDGGDMDQFGGPPSVGPPSSDGGSRPSSPQKSTGRSEGEAADNNLVGTTSTTDQVAADQTTLMHNEEESFALAPVDSTTIKSGWPRTKRKRKLIVDEIKNISGEEMKSQLSDTTDIVTTLDLAPPSKRLMHWKETGGVEKLFALSGRSLNAIVLGKMYIRNLTSEYSHNEDFGLPGDKEIDHLRLEQVREEDADVPYVARPRGRPPKRKLGEIEMNSESSVSVRSTRSKSGEESFNELIATRDTPDEQPEKLARLSVPSLNDESIQNDIENSAEVNGVPEIPPKSPIADTHHFDDFDAGQNHDDSGDEAHPFSPVDQVQGATHTSPTKADDGIDNEEQAEDETYEEFEERVVNKRAGVMFQKIKKTLRNDTLKFAEFTKSHNRKVVAQKFYTILVLKKLQAVELQQSGAYEDIIISRGTSFENAKL